MIKRKSLMVTVILMVSILIMTGCQDESEETGEADDPVGEEIVNTRVGDYVWTSGEDLYENSEVVIVGQFIGTDSVTMEEGQLEPITTDTYKIIKVVKNQNGADLQSGEVRIEYIGGQIPLQEYIDAIPDQMEIKESLQGLTEEQLEGSTYEVVLGLGSPEVNPEKSKKDKFLIFLNTSTNQADDFAVMSDGYGMRKISGSKVYNPDTEEFEKLSFFEE